MALLQMGANVETNGYPSRFYSTRNFIFGNEGNTWASSNGKGDLINDGHRRSGCSLSSVPSPASVLGYDKELVKQTILRHEAMVKDQIQELHRVYQKQRELMDEVRRNELEKHKNLSIEISWSGSVQENITQSRAAISLVEGGLLKHSKPSNYNLKKIGNKILDLELPAEEYIDCEDERVAHTSDGKKPEHVNKEKNSEVLTWDGLLLGPSSAQLVSEGLQDLKNTNSSLTPASCSETRAFQSIWVNDDDKENKFQDKMLVFPVHAADPSNICQIQSDNQKNEGIGRHSVLGVNSSCTLPDLGDDKNNNANEKKHNCLTRIIDLNSCLNEDVVDIPVDVHFPAPDIPPARGESDDKQEQEVRIAAEALVSISATESSMEGSPLYWFAKIVSSIEDHGMDYFKAMNLNLDWCGNNKMCEQNGKRGGCSSPSRRREVTEDLQVMEGLMEASGNHSEWASRTSASKGRKRGGALGSSKVAESLLKTDMRIEKRGVLVSWERTYEKRRGKRYPTSKTHDRVWDGERFVVDFV